MLIDRSILGAPPGDARAVLPVLERADGTLHNQTSGSSDGAIVEVAGAALTALQSLVSGGSSDAAVLAAILAALADPASQTTLAALLARTPALGQALAASSSPVVLTALHAALLGGVRHATAPALADTATQALELARDGSLRVSADLSDWRPQAHLVASTAAQRVAIVRTAPTYPFDGVCSDTDGVVVYGQPRGRPLHVPDGLTMATPSAWTTAGTDWTIAAGAATHAASAGGTDTLVPAAMGAVPLIVGRTYLVYTRVTHRGGTGVTAYCGTAAGTQITAGGEHVQALVCTGSDSAQLVASDDWDGDVLAYAIYPHTPRLVADTYGPYALTEVLGVAASSTLTTLIAAASCGVYGLYRRCPGAVDLG
jgi:hypothetical protein